ncbi:MAG: hypothetical protein J3K34DRAFT_457787 [Monoraphidium minutum]|nr:MAG: hypothetical protein J3K34DRAFT_457787 [Monoraphidium minutum]
MERPGSRGSMTLAGSGLSKAPTGSPIERPERPSTGNRPAHGGALTAPGTPGAAGRGAAGQQPPSRAYKRAPAGGLLAGGGGALARGAPALDARPLTQQGIGGMAKPGTAAGGRQVLDRNYFVSQLRQKRQEIVNATHQLQEEVEELQQRQAAAARAANRAAELQAAVRAQQEALADANIVLDKAGSHAPLDSIAAELEDARARNAAARARAEAVAGERMALEAAARGAEARVAALEAAAEARLADLVPGQRAAYQALHEEREGLLAEAAARDAALAELDGAIAAAEGELGRNAAKQRALQLQETVRQLQQRRADLAAEEERAKASPEEQKEALMAKVKRDNAELKRLAAAAKAAQDEVRALEARAAAAAAAPGRGGGGAPGDAADEQARREKYQELCAKEREIAAFIDAFPSRRDAKRRELAERQDAVAAALERLAARPAGAGGSAGGGAQQPGAPPAPAGAAPASELAARAAELEKINGLGIKISEELSVVGQRVSEAAAEAERLSDAEGARAAAAARREALEARRAELAGARDGANAALAALSRRQEEKEAALSQHTAWPAARAAEQRLASLQAAAAEARAGAAARGRGGGAAELVEAVAGLVAEVNAALLAAPPQLD